MGNYTKSSRDIYLFSPICLDSLVNSMDSKLDWSHFSLNFLPRQIWKNTTQLLFVVRNACCFFPVWRKSKCVDLFHGDLCMGPHTHTHFKGIEVALFDTKILTSEVKPPKSRPKRPPTWLQDGVIHHEYLFVQLTEPHFREFTCCFFCKLTAPESSKLWNLCPFTTKNQKQTYTYTGRAWNLTLLEDVGFGICWYTSSSYPGLSFFFVKLLNCAKKSGEFVFWLWFVY